MLGTAAATGTARAEVDARTLLGLTAKRCRDPVTQDGEHRARAPIDLLKVAAVTIY